MKDRAVEREHRTEEREPGEWMTNFFVIALLGKGASYLIAQNNKTKDS